MPDSDPINPYQSPVSEVVRESSNSHAVRSEQIGRIRGFLSPSGSFSRGELLIASVVLVTIGILLSSFHRAFPVVLPAVVLLGLKYGLYFVWGVALGKRSRDMGTTFTYGMVVGMLFPVIGIVFLFQEGAKEKARKSLPTGPSSP